MNKTKYKEMNLDQLTPAPYNPRLDLQEGEPEFENLKNSIQEFGFVEPIIYNEATGYIVGGHQRVKALKALGHTKALCVIVNLTSEQEKALNIGLNKIGGDWDYLKLKELLTEIDSQIDINLTGFNSDEIDALMREYFEETDIREEDDFDAEAHAEAIIEPISKPGDIWQLGAHRLMVGDATRQDHVIKLMDGAKADCVISDPPYNVDYEGKTKEKLKIVNDKMGGSDFLTFLIKAFTNWHNVLIPGGPFYIYHADLEGKNFRTAVEQSGLELKQILVWVKNTIVLSRQDHHWQHEPIIYGWKPGAAHKWYGARNKSNVIDDAESLKELNKKQLIALINDMRNNIITTVIREDKPSSSRLHPTMKPLKLIRFNMSNSTKRGDRVLDTFAGSGSTLIAAEQLGRVCYAIEKDPIYSDVIIKRYEEFTQQKAVLLP